MAARSEARDDRIEIRTTKEEKRLRTECREILDRMSLGHLADRPAFGLPFGTLKRLEFARGQLGEGLVGRREHGDRALRGQRVLQAGLGGRVGALAWQLDASHLDSHGHPMTFATNPSRYTGSAAATAS